MGRKGGKKGGGGMKGFVKQTRTSKTAEDAASTTSSSSSADAPVDAARTVEAAAAATSLVLGSETKAQMRERHKKELNAAKKEAAKLGKKKKQEATLLVDNVKTRHAEELLQFKERTHASDEETEVEVEKTLTTAKKSKAQKRREKEAQRLEEREARIREDMATLGETERESEERKLAAQLEKIGYCIYEIRPDGHCLFKAIEDQLHQLPDVTSKLGYLELRAMAAEELTTHAELYESFYDVTDGTFLEHCDKIASTAEWGGELEIQALTAKLQRPVILFSVQLGEKILGEQFRQVEPIRLCFMEHAYHLGAHYNSVHPASIC